MFDDLKAAKLLPADVAKLLKCSRVTASLWYNDHTTPHPMIVPRLKRLSAGVRSAIAAGDLPLKGDVARSARYPKIAATIKRHLELRKIGSISE